LCPLVYSSWDVNLPQSSDQHVWKKYRKRISTTDGAVNAGPPMTRHRVLSVRICKLWFVPQDICDNTF